MSKLRVLDLFSGIGGFSLGFRGIGEPVAFCEINPFSRDILRKHWPEAPVHHDVRTAEFERPVDLVTAGFPCQDISSIGNRAGLAGERSGLFWCILRAVRMVGQPRLLLENVAELLAGGMGDVCGALAEVGYDAEWHCIPAGAIGAPHERDRVWIIADAQGVTGFHEPYAGEIAKRLPNDHAPAKARLEGAPDPAICRVDDGIPDRVDRTEALGNAVDVRVVRLLAQTIQQRSE